MDRHVERPTTAGAARRHRLLVDELLAVPVEQGDAKRGLEHVGIARDATGIAERSAPGRAVDEDVRQDRRVIGPADRTVEDGTLATEGMDLTALDLEEDRLDRRELGQGVDDLREPTQDRRAPAARFELA